MGLSFDIPQAPEVFPPSSLVRPCISSGCAVIVERLVASMLMDCKHSASRADTVVLAKDLIEVLLLAKLHPSFPHSSTRSGRLAFTSTRRKVAW